MNYLYEEAERTKMIEEFFKKNPVPISRGKILDIENDKPELYDVYEMPFYFFVHNWNNGRHFSEAQDMKLKFQKETLDPVRDNGLIEQMLYKSKEERNNITKANLERFTQQEPIIATKTGIIIDGNRRFLLLKQIWRDSKNKLDLSQQTIKVIILKKNYSHEDLNSLETKIQFRKESKLDYDPINKKIKIFNMYEEMLKTKGLENKIEKFKVIINTEIVKDIANNTGESEAKIKEYIKIISFVKWFLQSKNANNLMSSFLNKDDQLKSLYKVIKNLDDNKRKSTEFKLWYESDVDNVENMIIDAAMYQILHKVKAVGSFREIMASKGKLLLEYQDFFEEWYQETINIVGNDILKFDFSLSKKDEIEEKRKILEKLNEEILDKIEIRRRQEFREKEKESINNGKTFEEMQVKTAINFIHRRLEYFESVEKISEEEKKQLSEILNVLNKFS